MDRSIEWNVQVGKKEFLENLKQPGKIVTLLTAFAFLFFIIFELVKTLEGEISVPITISFSVVLLLLILIAVYSYKTNKELFKDESRHYKVDSSGVTINGKLYPWSNYKYFSDDTKLVENTSGMLPAALAAQPVNRWLIQLLVEKFSDKNKLILVMDNKEIYNEVQGVVKERLEESSSVS
jgi:uncharacterized membrane protein (DUF485 family)